MAQQPADIPVPAATTAELQGRLKAFAAATDTTPSKVPKPHQGEEKLADTNDLAVLSGRAKFVGSVDGGGGTNMLQLDITKGGKLEEARNFEALHVTKGEWEQAGNFAGWGVIEPKTMLVNTGHIGGQIGVLGVFDNKGVVANSVTVEPKARMTNTGTVSGRVDVRENAWFAGNGTVGLLNVAGQLEVGPEIGAPTVTQNLSLSKTANLIYRVNAEGDHATIKVGGIAHLNNATLTITSVPGEHIDTGGHTVIQAKKVEGEFGQVVSQLAYVTAQPHYPGTEVRLTYVRNGVLIEDAANTPNGKKFGSSVVTPPANKPPKPALVDAPAGAQVSAAIPEDEIPTHQPVEPLKSTEATPRPASQPQTASTTPKPNAAISALLGTNLITAAEAIDQLGGYDTADLGNATLSSMAPISAGMISAMGQNHPGSGYADGQVWVQALGNSGTLGKQLDRYALKHSTKGLMLGTDWAVSPEWRLGIIGSKSQTRLDGYRFDGGLDSWHVGAYALRQDGPLALRFGATFGSHDGTTKRHVAFNRFSDHLKGRYDARTHQAFTQVGYSFDVAQIDVEPYVHLGYQRYQRDRYTEKGGDAALQVNSQAQDTYHSNLGLRLARGFAFDQGMALSPRLNVGWKHRYGEVRGLSRQRLANGGNTYTIEGIELDRDSLLVEAGLDLAVSPRHTLGLSYNSETGQDNRNGALLGQWRMMF
ncbi:autotransporter outer membrane beta-barrel domain-containing protein [Pseudomonas sp. RGM2987]|uniref:autotransporter outer membrane beta-barrel domain-containing protein n=1 Tax=Pseudomonas sp. RGM2987 TaxID=2930090 RepID=UPI001FD6DAA3|nr:autotransporter outer membrane beta-barrel domain-containing protein [Pseudomonas sp. RGM2987]MCJ8205769.1 autotransporter outer membrane beta-barrel domain-containing protein [Pseudomonas sp. RGM2987]